MSIPHFENLIFKGSESLLNFINAVYSEESCLSVKWDGTPAIVFGWDERGVLILGTKSFFNKTPKYYRSQTDIINDVTLNDSLKYKLDKIYYYLNNIQICNLESEVGYKGGDFDNIMFGADVIAVKNSDQDWVGNKIIPNVVEYDFSEHLSYCTNLPITLAVHTFYEINSEMKVKETESIHNHDHILELMSKYTEVAFINTSVIDDRQVQVQELFKQQEKIVEQFCESVNLDDLLDRRLGGNFLKVFERYQNWCIREGFDYLSGDDSWFNRFDAYCQLEAEKEADKVIREDTKYNKRDYYDEIRTRSIMDSEDVKSLLYLQNHLKSICDKVQSVINDPHGHEGYVIDTSYGIAKFVDRKTFSMNNFRGSRNA